MAAACSSDDGNDNGGRDPGSTPTGDQTTPASPGEPLASVSDVPVGDGILVDGPDGQLLLVQPTAGEFKAYDPTCTHMGTTIGTPQDGVMTCPNHGSQFEAADGSVVKGPAERALAEVAVTVDGDSIVLA